MADDVMDLNPDGPHSPESTAEAGQRQKFPCGEYLAITAELTGKDKTDG